MRHVYLNDTDLGTTVHLGCLDYDSAIAKVAELRKRYLISGLSLADGYNFVISVTRA